MNYYNNNESVKEYIKMSDDYSGTFLIDKLRKHLTPGSSVLELGMGPGKDLNTLSKYFKTIGSDSSQVFLDLYKLNNKNSDLLNLDAVTLDTERIFDGIYSNKVLIHLDEDELRLSFLRQYEVLREEGIIFHSFWYGQKVETFFDMKFYYYTPEKILKIAEKYFSFIKIEYYAEMENEDSFYVIMKKRSLKVNE